EYAKLKELTQVISEKGDVDQYPVKVPYVFPKIDEKRLVHVVKSALQEVDVKQKVYVIKRENYSIEKTMDEIKERYESIELFELLRDSNSRYEIIVKFLAILELLRLKEYDLDEDLVLRKVVKSDATT
ncbi:MAG TPA: segregation/condensation protein A, partial [Fervidobacterium sp.]|nr:segregation/condensation protein A [Fervidobacterium sp.]